MTGVGRGAGMRRRAWVGLTLLLLPAGCADRGDEYLKVFREQKAAMGELAEVLEGVKSEKDLPAAKAELDERVAKFEAVARRAREMRPPPEDVVRRLEDERLLLERAARRLQEEVRRVAALPGGVEFLKQFERDKSSPFGAKLP